MVKSINSRLILLRISLCHKKNRLILLHCSLHRTDRFSRLISKLTIMSGSTVSPRSGIIGSVLIISSIFCFLVFLTYTNFVSKKTLQFPLTTMACSFSESEKSSCKSWHSELQPIFFDSSAIQLPFSNNTGYPLLSAPAYCHLQKNFPVRNSSKWQLLSGSGQPDAACSHIFIYVSESASEFYAVSSILLILCFLLPRTSSR